MGWRWTGSVEDGSRRALYLGTGSEKYSGHLRTLLREKGDLMHFYFPTDGRPRGIAKKLKRCAEEKGIGIRLTAAQNAMARVYGYRDWLDLLSTIGAEPPSPWDCNVEHDEVVRRRKFQISQLSTALGVEELLAAEIIDVLRPTENGVLHPHTSASLEIGGAQMIRKSASGGFVVTVKKRTFDLTRAPGHVSRDTQGI